MAEEPPPIPSSPPEAAEFPAEPVLHRWRPSLVWLIPLVAAAIGAWMTFKAYSERSPTITITFQSAEGLEAGTTRIRHKDVEVGRVTSVALSPDFSQVVVTAELDRGAYRLLSENTRFWVVRARVGTGGITGLSTLLSGAYIGMDPGPRGKPQRAFKGLESAPMLARPLPEELVELRAGRLGSLSVGSPVTYRQVPVGEVVGYDLDPGGDSVLVRLQVRSPYHQLIRTDTRFWDAGGVDARFDTGGLHLHVDSMAHLVLGGVAFENPAGSDPGPAQGHVFTLYPDREQAFRTPLLDRHYFLLRFQESVHGLAKGAPVEFRGLPVGQVEDFPLAPGPDPAQELARGVPVLVSLDPERLSLASGPALERTLDRLVRRGLRAQLRPGSLVTGGLYVDLGFFPGAGRMARERDHWVLPTMPSTLTALADHLTTLLQRLQSLPLEDIAARLRDVLPALRATLDQAQALSARLDRDTAPRLEAALDQVRATLAALQRGLDPDAPVPGGLRDALDQLTRAARALRDLADSLEQHPESLVFGKGRTP